MKRIFFRKKIAVSFEGFISSNHTHKHLENAFFFKVNLKRWNFIELLFWSSAKYGATPSLPFIPD